MIDDTAFDGRCACGDVRFRMTAAPLFVHACHCTECRRLTGSAFALNALIEADRVQPLAGKPEPVAVNGTSGRPQTIFRCPRCRVALWSHYPGAGPQVCFVRIGTLDEPGRLEPDIHIYTSSRLPWLTLPQGARAVPEYYDMRELWPTESQERWRRLKQG